VDGDDKLANVFIQLNGLFNKYLQFSCLCPSFSKIFQEILQKTKKQKKTALG